MLDKVYLTRSEMARARRLDPRNKQLQRLVPDGILLMGSKAIPIFRGGPFVVARLSAAGGTVDPKDAATPTGACAGNANNRIRNHEYEHH